MGARTRYFTTKQIGCLFVLSCLVCTFTPVTSTAQPSDWWDDAWSSRIELTLPIDLSDEVAFQPIDTSIEFTEDAWAVDEQHHSVRIVMHTDDDMIELP